MTAKFTFTPEDVADFSSGLWLGRAWVPADANFLGQAGPLPFLCRGGEVFLSATAPKTLAEILNADDPVSCFEGELQSLGSVEELLQNSIFDEKQEERPELSAGECRELENSLNEDEQKWLEAELSFESALSNNLKQDGECPDDLWASLKEQMQAESAKSVPESGAPALEVVNEKPARRQRTWFWSVASLAAAVILMASFWFYNVYNPIILEMPESGQNLGPDP